MKHLTIVDLFCGAGGTTTGIKQAAETLGYELDLIGINHWDVAIATHKKNHPQFREPKCADIELIKPREIVPSGRLDILWASPECTHFSIARGGKPVSDQKRSSANRLLDWLDDLYVETLLIENVKEFLTWGPIGADGKPMKSKRGSMFRAFVESLKARAYRVEWKVLNAANAGAATTRERLFIQARRGNKPINWPQAKRTKTASVGLFNTTQQWRPAREIIQWDIKGKSIFNRPKPLARSTMLRLIAGLEQFNPWLEPFIVILRNNATTRSVNEPLPTITAGGGHFGLVQGKPFILPHRMFDGMQVDSIDKPLRTFTAKGASDFALVQPQPFVMKVTHTAGSGSYVRSIDDPLSTITTAKGGEHALAQPYLVPFFGERKGQTPRTHSIDEPLPAVTSHEAGGMVEPIPFILPTNHGANDRRTCSMDSPMPTITAFDSWAMAKPYLMKYCSTGGARSVDDPVDTITTKDRFGLITPLIIKLEDGNYLGLDILFRMLTPRELARAMSFPDDYEFAGTREQVVRQIGNAVVCVQAQAIVEAVLTA